jgi:sulfate/thiosulfate transport system ATP-binding protein
MSIAVTVKNIEKNFQRYPALRGVSLNVEGGELIALLGPSGSGKTTLLRTIAGLEQQDHGQVLFGDINANQLTLRERRIGFVFQQYALFKHMTVMDNISFGLRARPRATRPGKASIRDRVHELLNLVQLDGLEARYLAIEPRVLLLDEPFGALDAKVRKDLRRWLRELHTRTGHTTVFVTHDQEEAFELADRVAILNQGKIEQVGTPHQIVNQPANDFVADFVDGIKIREKPNLNVVKRR